MQVNTTFNLKFNIGTTGDGAARADDFEKWIGLARVVSRQLGNAESRILFDEADHLTGRRLDHDLLQVGKSFGRLLFFHATHGLHVG